jgi:predicted TIM-barrel fold metal-dependent hydrolase
MCRDYNRWLAHYCKPYPDRLFSAAMLPMQSVELAIDEMRYARQALGMRGGSLRPNPHHGNNDVLQLQLARQRSVGTADYRPGGRTEQRRSTELRPLQMGMCPSSLMNRPCWQV